MPARIGVSDPEADAIRLHSNQVEQFAARYRDLEDDPYASCFGYSRRRLDGWLEALLPEPRRAPKLLDVGCGTGHHLARFAARGFDVTGVDGSLEMLRQARPVVGAAPLRRAMVGALPVATGSFDVVVCLEVLRYLPDPAVALRECGRVLRPGGVCVVTAAPRFNLNGYWAVNRLAARVPLPRLVRLKQYFTTERTFRGELARAGFDAIEIHGVYFGAVNWIERLAPRALPRALRTWERYDRLLADRPLFRELSNMFVARAVRRSDRSSGEGA